MRVLVLVVGVLLSTGSAKNAQQRHAVRSMACNSNSTMSPMARQNCVNTANVQYGVETQRELADEQNARADQQQQAAYYNAAVQRCEAVARNLLTCQLIRPADARQARDYCIWAVGPTADAKGYGLILCHEQARDCAGMTWCASH